jgi:hypothetical protein
MTRALVLLALLALAQPVAAQAAPQGPADVISGARKAREARDLQQATRRDQSSAPANPHATVANPHAGMAIPEPAQNAENPHAGMAMPEPAQNAENPHAGMAMPDADNPQEADNPHTGMASAGEPPPISSDRPDPSLPTGSLRVRVLDKSGAPVADAEVSLGIMVADGSRSSRELRTGPDGSAVVAGLAAGERQAYRVNVPYQGAKYSSTPFRLPPSGGYEVSVRRLPVTRDERMVVLYLGATSLELKDDRIKIVQEAQLLNLGGATYVFPEAGVLVPLPKGFMAVQSQESMSDQHVVEAPGEGLRVHGSLPPGQATVLWGFDLPLHGTEARFTIPIPWLTFAYRVIADAPEGMSLEVAGMPEPGLHKDSGRRFLVTEIQRKVGDVPFRTLEISLRGIPGPGPARDIAVVLALCALAAGVVISRRGPRPVAGDGGAPVDALKTALLDRARELQALREAGETGPEYHAEQMSALTDELAALLFERAEPAKVKKAAR